MTCEHLIALERALLAAGAREIARGPLWGKRCREWVYFDVVLDIAAARARFGLAPCVAVHENLDPRSGTERGFVCKTCNDAVMGRLAGAPAFPDQ
ncbi:MAG: hypothetical protein Tsb0020_18090 [Haliangiales bacterium]